MPKPAHTPVNFLKGGGNAVFSTDCINLLSDVGFSPDDFGTHNALSERQKALRARAKRVLDASRENQERHGGPLTGAAAARRETAQRQNDVEIAHMGQNGAKQRQRGNPCSNMVTGHDEGEYPCVRLGGPAFGKGGTIDESTEHGHQSANEVKQARAGDPPRKVDASQKGEKRKDGTPPDAKSVYPADQMAKDERARCQDVCKERAKRSGKTGSQDAGAMPPEPSQKQRDSLEAYDNALKNRNTEKDQPPTEIDGETAAECMDTFHKMGVAAMNKKCEESVADNEKRAGTPEQRRKAREAAEAAEKRADDLSGDAKKAQKELESANRQAGQLNSEKNSRAKLKEDGKTPVDQAKYDQLQKDRAASDKRVADAQAACDAEGTGAGADHAKAQREAQTARTKSSTMDNAHCKAEQGKTLKSGKGVRKDGRVPGGKPPKKKTGTSSTDGTPDKE